MSTQAKAHEDGELTSLEPILALENVIHHLAVLACISAVDQVCEGSESRGE